MPERLQEYSTQALHALKTRREAVGKRIELVFFDVDGTLVDTQRNIPATCTRELNRIKQQGIKTAIASGRPAFACTELINQQLLNGAGCFCTGAVLYDPKADHYLLEHTIEQDLLRKLVDMARAATMHLELYTHKQYFIEHTTQYTDYHTSYLKQAPCVSSFDAILQNKLFDKALIVASTHDEKRALDAIVQQLPELRFYTGHGPDRPDINFVSILSASACKQRAFELLCDYHRVEPANVMAIGDAQSDLAFIRAAGTGVAMGNASDAVKAQADFISTHVDADGLALALRALVGER